MQDDSADLIGRSGSWAASLTAGSYKQAFMHALRGRDVAVSAAAIRVLCGFLLNKSIDTEILDAAGDVRDKLLAQCMTALHAAPLQCHTAVYSSISRCNFYEQVCCLIVGARTSSCWRS